MRVLYHCLDAHWAEMPGITLGKLPIGQGDGIPALPDFSAICKRWQALDAAAKPEFGPVDLVVTEPFGGAYFRGVFRRGLKMQYERRVMAQLLNIVRRKGARLAVIDQCDDLAIHPINEHLLEVCDVYFKRELAIDRWRSLESLHGGCLRMPTIGYRLEESHQLLMQKLAPISLGLGGTESEALKLSEGMPISGESLKIHDIFYAGDDWCRPLRQSIRHQLQSCSDPGLAIRTHQGQMPFVEFALAIHSSWLCISPPGLGWDCYRHYEAGLFGSVPVLSRPDITAHRAYIHGHDAIYYEPERPLLEQLQPWLADKPRLIEMARLARERVLHYHTRTARTQYMIDTLFAGKSPHISNLSHVYSNVSDRITANRPD